MRPPTGNDETQKKHGAYNAVDYSYQPDIYIYAPEDYTFYAYLPNAGDAGNNLQITGATGRHGFCHLEECYIKPGQSGKKGDRIGKMGYTGLTEPKGPDGRHLHWVILQNGVYVYPPDLVTEPFVNTLKGDSVVKPTYTEVLDLFKKYEIGILSEKQQNSYVSQDISVLLKDILQFNYDRRKEAEAKAAQPATTQPDPDGEEYRKLKQSVKKLLS
jgi:murein DD-endopeptidase MepM/ murein hydrolase activator NlpD